MDKIATENLFLLEFLVDSVTLDPKCECDAPPGETCVSFQFLDNAPLDVCEADFNPNRNLRNDKESSVKSGKSCLFSLSPDQATGATEQFDIFVSVMRKMQPGWLPDKVEIGVSVISISNLFNELISSVELSDGSTPTAKTLKDNFDISDSSGTAIGKISVYIRMSCFGKLIVTQFQMNLDDKSVLFKDKEGKSLYRYKKAGKKGKGDPKQGGFNSTCPETPCVTNGPPPPQSNPYANADCPFAPCPTDQLGPPPTNAAPCQECGGMQAPPCLPPQMGYPVQAGPPQGYNGGYSPMGGMGGQFNTPCNECGFLPNAPCAIGGADQGAMMGYAPPSAPPEGNYQEIGASMGGNSLTIRVHKDKSRVEQVDPDDDCICGGSNALAPKGYPQKTQQAFSMRPGATPNSPFSFRMGQCGDAPNGGDGGNNVVVNPPVCTAPDGTQFTEFSDPNKETFILRIGKKSEGTDKKNNLELELQTPKGPPLKPIPKKETIETQWDPLDAGADDSKSGGKKGGKNGGKGDKKGKGKGKKK